MAKNYAFSYKEDHYHIYNVGDTPDDSLKFPIPEGGEEDQLIEKLTIALSDCAEVGDRMSVDKSDCKLTKEVLNIFSTMLSHMNDESTWADIEDNGLTELWKDIKFLIKRLTVITNRQAAYLRGER